MEESKNTPINDYYFSKIAAELGQDTSVRPDYEGLKRAEEEAYRLRIKSSSRNKMTHLTPKKKKRK